MMQAAIDSSKSSNNGVRVRQSHHSRASAFCQQQQQQQQQKRQQQSEDIDSSAHFSLAAMSTNTTADISSIGDTTTQYSLEQQQSRRRRRSKKRKEQDKNDCHSESRCTVGTASDCDDNDDDESGRSRGTQRRRLLRCESRRWLVDQKTTPVSEGAPIRPQRSADDILAHPSTSAAAAASEGFNQSLRRLGAAPVSLREIGHATGVTRSESARRFDATSSHSRRQILRCSSKRTLPPVQPKRNDSQSDLDICASSDSEDENDDDDKHTDEADHDKTEFDKDMFARLLQGQQDVTTAAATTKVSSYLSLIETGNSSMTHTMAPPLSAPAAMASSSGTHAFFNEQPPRRPRRASDADSFLYAYQEMQRRKSLLSCSCPNKIATSSSSTGSRQNGEQHVHRHQDCSGQCQQAILDSAGPRGSAAATTDRTGGKDTAVGMDTSAQTLDTVLHNKEAGTCHLTEDRHQEEEDDLEEALCSASGKEYDPDLFQRLLSGDVPASSPAPNRSACNIAAVLAAAAESPPPTLLPRVSSGFSAATAKAAGSSFCKRFDGSIPFTSPEHFQGAIKSSHPPMRPRRSIDSCDPAALSLAYVAAAACKAQTSMANTSPCSMVINQEEPMLTRTISLVGGKRRAPRRSFSRRQTLPLSMDPDSREVTEPVAESNDPTSEAKLTAFSSSSGELHCPEGDPDVLDLREGLHEEDDHDIAKTTSGSYLRILPVRRRMARRFTMPYKGRVLSPISKKPRVERSLSCYSNASDESMNPRAA